MRHALLLVVVSTICGVACGAFEDLPEEQVCHDIPPGGCPAPLETDGSATANCVDPSCDALYACDGDAGWLLVAHCPGREAGTDTDAMAGMHPDANDLRDTDFDVPEGASGGSGCVDLQAPDCPLSLALACPKDQCCCCQALWVCADGGWDQWGECVDGGALVKSSPFPDSGK
jgi:hypothetical protein